MVFCMATSEDNLLVPRGTGRLPVVVVTGDKRHSLVSLLLSFSSVGVANTDTSIRHAPHAHGRLYFITVLYNPAVHRCRRCCDKKECF